MLIPIENTPRDYAWGRAGAISALLGGEATDAVEAELWLGAHRGWPSRIVGDDTTLVDVVPDLPYLLKVLAIGAPLSIQAHPDAEQARQGFERENAAGIPIDAPERSYRDPYAKPELVVAVSERFEALAGFRPAEQARTELETVVAVAGGARAIAPLLDRLRDDATVGDALAWLLAETPEAVAAIAAVSDGL
ncbi:MAG TPA: type I phosphomannose isomerase catalytic subunit, partial [Microbacteriaceae bacterium]|nr:type I phosphomannose isomerase catalytic subunit [Microbacteriaceae bacterium]